MAESQKINKFFIDLLEKEKKLLETETSYVRNQAERINNSQKPIPREELSEDRKKNLRCLKELHDFFNFLKNPIHQGEELELLKTLKTSLEKPEKGYEDKANLIEQLIINVDDIRREEQEKAKVILERLKEQRLKEQRLKEQEKMARLERLREQRLEEQKKMKVRLERLDEQKKMALRLREVARQTLIQKQKPEDLQQQTKEEEKRELKKQEADGAEKERLNEQKAKMAENKAAAQTSINKASSPTLRDENPTNKTPSTSLRMILNSVLKVTPLLSPFLPIRF